MGWVVATFHREYDIRERGVFQKGAHLSVWVDECVRAGDGAESLCKQEGGWDETGCTRRRGVWGFRGSPGKRRNAYNLVLIVLPGGDVVGFNKEIHAQVFRPRPVLGSILKRWKALVGNRESFQ